MKKDTDLALNENAGYWDLAIAEDGDFEKTNSFDTAIYLSIYCERRASETEVPEAFLRRGWIGNINRPVEYGSKLWLLHQARLTNKTVNDARTYLQQCLRWLVDKTYLKSVIVESVTRDIEKSKMTAKVKLVRFDDSVEYRNFILWENTGAA